MPDEQEKAKEAPLKTEAELPVPAKKPDPVDELGATIDQFFAGIQSIGLKSMRSLLTKADAMIEKLDVGDPPKKP